MMNEASSASGRRELIAFAWDVDTDLAEPSKEAHDEEA